MEVKEEQYKIWYLTLRNSILLMEYGLRAYCFARKPCLLPIHLTGQCWHIFMCQLSGLFERTPSDHKLYLSPIMSGQKEEEDKQQEAWLNRKGVQYLKRQALDIQSTLTFLSGWPFITVWSMTLHKEMLRSNQWTTRSGLFDGGGDTVVTESCSIPLRI